MTILVLLLGLCLSVSSADCRETGPTDHCGAAAHEGHQEAAGAQVSEDRGAGHGHHAAAQETCPVNAAQAGGSGHQCRHHRASGADDDYPSLYCNCHAKHTDGRTGHTVQETSCLMPRIASVAPAMPHVPSLVLAEGFLKIVFLDPVEKPPTIS